MAMISQGDDSDTGPVDPERGQIDMQHVTESKITFTRGDAEKASPSGSPVTPGSEAATPRRGSIVATTQAEDRKKLDHSAKWARFLCVALALVFVVLWPMPLFGSGYVFSREFFTGWTVVGIIWLFCSAGVVVFLPLWQSRTTIAHTARSIVADITGKGRKK